MPGFEIKRWIYAAGFDVDAGPPDPEDFCVTLWIDAVEQGREGVTTYEIEVCTPMGLVSNFDRITEFSARMGAPPGCIFGRGVLLVKKYNVDLIERAIEGVGENLKYYAFDAS